ncbi:MAG: hypothetical protein QXG39_04890 [Candidatus Aenigmatarchaeota archaeon]
MPTISTIPQTVNVDDETIEISPEGKIRVKDGGIISAKIKNAEITPEKLSFGTMEKIIEYVVPSNTNSITLNNIPPIYSTFCLITQMSNSGLTPVYLRFNNDTGTNYDYVGFNTSGTAIYEHSGSGDSIYYFTSNIDPHFAITWITNHSSLNKNVLIIARALISSSGRRIVTFGRWLNTNSKITSITFFATTNFVANQTRFVLYGVR